MIFHVRSVMLKIRLSRSMKCKTLLVAITIILSFFHKMRTGNSMRLKKVYILLFCIGLLNCARERQWQEIKFPGICHMGNVVWGNNQFAVLGNDIDYSTSLLGGKKYYFFSSPDGVTWTKQLLPAFFEGRLQWLNGQYFVVDHSDPGYLSIIKYSTDGINWLSINTSSIGSITNLAWDNNKYYTTGWSNSTSTYQDAIYYSADLVNWTQYIVKGEVKLFDIQYVNKLYFGNVYDSKNNNDIAVSNDGFTWKRVGLIHDNTHTYDFIYADDQYIAFGSSDIFVSKDGTSWTLKALIGPALRSMAHGNNDYVAVLDGSGSSLEIWSSLDLSFWRQYEYDKPLGFFDQIVSNTNTTSVRLLTSVAHNGSRYVISGYIDDVRSERSGIILTSP